MRNNKLGLFERILDQKSIFETVSQKCYLPQSRSGDRDQMTWLILTIYGNRHLIQRVTCWVKTYRDYSREINNVFEWTKGQGTDDRLKKKKEKEGKRQYFNLFLFGYGRDRRKFFILTRGDCHLIILT
jgi:uncharacterized C2H2 Zn-finger protein